MPEAWARVEGEKTEEIAAFVAAGALLGKGRGKALAVQAASFYGWLDEPVPVYPEWGCAYDVRPDGEAEEVGVLRYRREEARQAYRDGPTRLVLYRADFADHPAFYGEPGSQINELVDVVKRKFQEGVVGAWRQVRAIEMVVDEIGEEFGEDPCVPDVRHTLDESKECLTALHKDAQKYVPPFELEEPDEDVLDEVRALTEREVALAT